MYDHPYESVAHNLPLPLADFLSKVQAISYQTATGAGNFIIVLGCGNHASYFKLSTLAEDHKV